MQLISVPRAVVASVGVWAILFAAWQACGQEPSSSETFAVSKTFNNVPFEYRIRLLAKHADFRVYRLTYPSPVTTPVDRNNTVPADYYLPKSIQPGVKYPAVICLHILDGNESLTDLVCSALAGRGIPAISFKLPYYGERGLPKGPEVLADDPKLFIGAIVQAGKDIRRTVDLLASRPEINPKRIGITGISLGGIIAATAAGAEPRLYRAGLFLAGGDLPQIIHHARETRQLSRMIQSLPTQAREEVEAGIKEADPLRFASALRNRAQQGRVLMINATDDEVIPRACTEKLAVALGVEDRVVWLKGLGHYTAVAKLPEALRTMTEFFAQDLPATPPVKKAASDVSPTGPRRVATLLQEVACFLEKAPKRGRSVDLEVLGKFPNGRRFQARLGLEHGPKNRFSIVCRRLAIGPNVFVGKQEGEYPKHEPMSTIAVGQGSYPWIQCGASLFAGTGHAANNPPHDPLALADPMQVMKLRMAAGLLRSVAMAPEMLLRWVSIEETPLPDQVGVMVRIAPKNQSAGSIEMRYPTGGKTPKRIDVRFDGFEVRVVFHHWEEHSGLAVGDPTSTARVFEVEADDVSRVFAAAFDFGLERLDAGGRRPKATEAAPMQLVARDPAGHGLLCRYQNKSILMVSGTPAQMGTAHGTLLRRPAQKLTERVLYLVGGGDTLRSGRWFLNQMAEIERRVLPHIPARFLEECDALSKAAGVSRRDGRYANLFPERFHCSGVALRGKATVGGRVLHARVLDYMREINLQDAAAVQVFMPEGRHAWMSLGYAGFIGTVTAMNERGVAVGEMGGRGQGQWDGLPMSFLLRDVMERASTVEEAVNIIRDTPRTCEYYYVISDKSAAMRALECTPNKVVVLRPGQQHPRLPNVPEDTVLISGEDRAEVLGRRIQASYGKIDVPKLIEIIKRPVSMRSNLHDAIFAPETLEMWFADASRDTPACDEPYVRVNLRKLLQFYREQSGSVSQ